MTLDEFDSTRHSISADDDLAPGYVIVEGVWIDPYTGRRGPAPLALDPADVEYDESDRGYALGAVLRAAVLEIAQEEALDPAARHIRIEIAGCPFAFTPDGMPTLDAAGGRHAKALGRHESTNERAGQ